MAVHPRKGHLAYLPAQASPIAFALLLSRLGPLSKVAPHAEAESRAIRQQDALYPQLLVAVRICASARRLCPSAWGEHAIRRHAMLPQVANEPFEPAALPCMDAPF